MHINNNMTFLWRCSINLTFFLDRETQGIHWKNTGNNNNNKDETKTKNNNRKEERKLGWWKVNEKLEKRLSCKSSFAQPSSLLFVLFFLFVILRNIMITMDMQPSSLLFVFFSLCHSKTYDNNHRYMKKKNLQIVNILFLFVIQRHIMITMEMKTLLSIVHVLLLVSIEE